MIRFSKLADYAVVILGAMQRENTRMSASGLSECTGLPEPTVAKVLKLLAKQDLVNSTRGAQGGYMLGRDAAQMHVAEIVMAVDGPVALAACVEGSDETCSFAGGCMIKGRWDQVNIAVKDALEGISLADMITPQMTCNNKKLEARG